MSKTDRAVMLAYVNLGEDKVPKKGKPYDLTTVSDEILASKEYPTSEYKRLNLDIYDLYINNLPDLWGKNEGLLKIQINTRNPQDIEGEPKGVTSAIKFAAPDNSYSNNFLYRGIFRNVLFREWINLKLDLYELDTDAEIYYNKIKNVMDNTPGLKNIDILNGVPYLNLATQLFEGIIKTFGKNPDDHVWDEIPIMEINPTPGGAFLRSGIYILLETKNSDSVLTCIDDFKFVDMKLKAGSNTVKHMPTHLVLGVNILSHPV